MKTEKKRQPTTNTLRRHLIKFMAVTKINEHFPPFSTIKREWMNKKKYKIKTAKENQLHIENKIYVNLYKNFFPVFSILQNGNKNKRKLWAKMATWIDLLWTISQGYLKFISYKFMDESCCKYIHIRYFFFCFAFGF